MVIRRERGASPQPGRHRLTSGSRWRGRGGRADVLPEKALGRSSGKGVAPTIKQEPERPATDQMRREAGRGTSEPAAATGTTAPLRQHATTGGSRGSRTDRDGRGGHPVQGTGCNVVVDDR